VSFTHYYRLAKPGIIYGNVITLAGGFALAMRGQFNFVLLLETLVGLSLVIASGGVFNNLIDSDIDSTMERTKGRELVIGMISRQAATIYGVVLGLLGFLILWFFTNLLTVSVAGFGYFAYLVLYTLVAKRRTVYGSVVGSLSGAVPPVVGYCAASNRFDAGAIILFAILFLWQIPHFFAISLYRSDEYAAAGVPVMPVVYGLFATKLHMAFLIAAFAIVAVLPALFGYTGLFYFAVATILSLGWLAFSLKGFLVHDSKRWARKMFFVSLIVLVLLFITMAIDVKMV
jgi:protoheme IX farnesyltransferase